MLTAWLADVLARIAGTPQGQLAELLPWNWSAGGMAHGMPLPDAA